jgi:hypothetical protein
MRWFLVETTAPALARSNGCPRSPRTRSVICAILTSKLCDRRIGGSQWMTPQRCTSISMFS